MPAGKIRSFSAKPADTERAWYHVDATDQVLGRLAAKIATVLMGKHKPIYTPHVDTGDFVVVTNAEKIKLTGRKLDEIILNIDFAELMLDYAGAKVPASMQGLSFRPVLRGQTPKDWRDAMYYHYWTHQPQRPSHYGIRTKRYKLLYYYGLIRMGRKPDECWELYDLSEDPHEHENRHDQPKYKPIIAELKARLQALRKEFCDTADPLKGGAQGARNR